MRLGPTKQTDRLPQLSSVSTTGAWWASRHRQKSAFTPYHTSCFRYCWCCFAWWLFVCAFAQDEGGGGRRGAFGSSLLVTVLAAVWLCFCRGLLHLIRWPARHAHAAAGYARAPASPAAVVALCGTAASRHR